MTKRIAKRLLCLLLALVCVAAVAVPDHPQVYADVEDDEELIEMRREYDKLEKKIAENQKNLADTKQSIRTNEQKLDDLSDEISNYEEQLEILSGRISVLNGDISDLRGRIQSTNGDIDEINGQIAEVEQKTAETEELMEQTRTTLLARLRESYMSGESSQLELLLSSTDLVTYFTRKELVTRVTENDKALIQQLTAQVHELEELHAQLDASKAALEEKKTQLNNEMNTLEAREADLKSSRSAEQQKKNAVSSKYEQVQGVINELDKDSAAYQKAIKMQQAEREILNREIDEYIRAHASSEGDTPDESYNNDGNMMFPVKGNTYITAGYPAYSDGSAHWGIDIVVRDSNGNNVSLNKPFYAAQGGEVILALNDGSWNHGFGNYCIIDHGDGVMTLYGHSNNIMVSKGQVVQKGQQIGVIGSTGNSTGPHLHFEVRVKRADGSVDRVQPLNYVSNPNR